MEESLNFVLDDLGKNFEKADFCIEIENNLEIENNF